MDTRHSHTGLAKIRITFLANRRSTLVAFCMTALLALPCGVSGHAATISEETPPTSCGNKLVAGITCTGQYCDNITPICGTTSHQVHDIQWSGFVSEEGAATAECVMPPGVPSKAELAPAFITGFSCKGSYCDNIALECVALKDAVPAMEQKCHWTSWISEEQRTLRFPPEFGAIRMQCRGRYCDDKRFFVCPLQAVQGEAKVPFPRPSFQMSAPVAGTIVMPMGSTLAKTTFVFPGDGQRNQNQAIGPFCCTGETATVATTGGTPVGYIYFYDFQDAVNVSGAESAARIVRILVSGASDFADPSGSQVRQAIEFIAGKKGSGRTVVAGQLRFTATLERARLLKDAGSRFDMGSLVIRVDVEHLTH